MTQAVGDPDELEKFANALAQFRANINEAIGGLNQNFVALGDTWQDEKRAEFEGNLDSLNQQIGLFDQCSEENEAYLHELAARLREYLGA